MINRKVDDAIFDVILAHAFREAFAQEMEQIEAEDSQPAQPSEKHRKHERAYYKKTRRKPIKVMTIVRSTAACVAAVICLSFGAMMFSPPVRAAVVDTLVGFFEKYVAVDVSDESTLVIDGYTFAYIPIGYKLVDRMETEMVTRYKFSNDSEYFKVCVYVENQHQLKYDTDQSNVEKLLINDTVAYFIQNESGYSSLIWTLNDKSFVIEGNIDPHIIKNIAEKIS